MNRLEPGLACTVRASGGRDSCRTARAGGARLSAVLRVLSLIQGKCEICGPALVLLVGLLAISTGPRAVAGTTVYTNESDFVSAIGQLPYFVNDFSNSVYYGWLVHSVKADSNGLNYAIASSPSLYLYGFPGVFTTVNATDQIVFNFSSGNVTGAGGYFYATAANGFSTDTNTIPTDGEITITLSDGTTTNLTSVAGESPRFIGFLSDGPIYTSLTITNSGGAGYPAAAHFYAVDGIPGLSMTLTNSNKLSLSWYYQPTGFVVQASSKLSGGVWSNLNVTPQLNGTQYEAQVPLGGAAGFFRLKK